MSARGKPLLMFRISQALSSADTVLLSLLMGKLA